MPELDILDRGRCLRWDASCLLLATIMVPDNDHRQLRQEYAAQLRVEKANGLPGGEAYLTKRDYVFAAKYRARKRIVQTMQTRRIHSILAGAMLWDLQTAVVTYPPIASKSKIEFTIDRISIAQEKLGSLAALQDAWRQFRPVIHWCAALVYQSRVFGRPFPQDSDIGYVGDVVILDLLALGSIFLAFAKDYVDFPASHRPRFWTTPDIHVAVPRRPRWPDAHLLVEGITLSPEFLSTASAYVIERDRVERPWLISGPGRRFDLARRRRNR
jgi:hypothetical protein